MKLNWELGELGVYDVWSLAFGLRYLFVTQTSPARHYPVAGIGLSGDSASDIEVA